MTKIGLDFCSSLEIQPIYQRIAAELSLIRNRWRAVS